VTAAGKLNPPAFQCRQHSPQRHLVHAPAAAQTPPVAQNELDSNHRIIAVLTDQHKAGLGPGRRLAAFSVSISTAISISAASTDLAYRQLPPAKLPNR